MTVPAWLDHPRIRGEHLAAIGAGLMLGGIIPAYAGSTVTCPTVPGIYGGSSPHTRGAPQPCDLRKSAAQDHPRIRGEHPQLRARRKGRPGIIPAYAGSTSITPPPHSEHLGIIPAYAGSTPSCISFLILSRGSSPHTRGAPSRRQDIRDRRGDHPRIRGEHSIRRCSHDR